MHTQEIILKLVAVVDTNKTFVSNEEEQCYTMVTSDITDSTPKKKALHERMVSFPGIHTLVRCIDFPKHKLSPSCPTIGQRPGLRYSYIPKDLKISIQTVVTDQTTEFSEEVNDDLILLIGQDIEVKEPLASTLSHEMMDCSEGNLQTLIYSSRYGVISTINAQMVLTSMPAQDSNAIWFPLP